MRYESSSYSISSPARGTLCLFHFSPSDGCIMVSHCDSNWNSQMIDKVEHIFYMFVGHLSIIIAE